MESKSPKVDIKGFIAYSKALSNAYTKLSYIWLTRRRLAKNPIIWIATAFVLVLLMVVLIAARYKKPVDVTLNTTATPRPTQEPIVVGPTDRFERSVNSVELDYEVVVDIVGTFERQGVTNIAYFTSVEKSGQTEFATQAPKIQIGTYEFEVRNKYNQNLLSYKFTTTQEDDGVARFRFTASLPRLTNSILFKLIENGKIYDRLYLSCNLFYLTPCTN